MEGLLFTFPHHHHHNLLLSSFARHLLPEAPSLLPSTAAEKAEETENKAAAIHGLRRRRRTRHIKPKPRKSCGVGGGETIEKGGNERTNKGRRREDCSFFSFSNVVGFETEPTLGRSVGRSPLKFSPNDDCAVLWGGIVSGGGGKRRQWEICKNLYLTSAAG